MNFRSPLAQVIGKGSAKEGSAHWWWQRITAIALVPLSLWFAFSAASFSWEGTSQINDWIASPFVSTLLIAFVVSLFYHAQLGIQVVIEDYIHHEGMKLFSVMFAKFLSVILVISSIISILRIALG